jgi:hypothetical protein
MKRIKFVGIAALLLTLLMTAPLQAQESSDTEQAGNEGTETKVIKEEPDIATLEKQSQEAYAAEKYVRYYGANIRMMNQRPYEPIYMKRVIEACALLERRRTAYHYMLKMQQQGFSYDFSEVDDAANIRTTELFDYLNNLMIEAGEPAGVAEPVLQVDEKYGQLSAMTWDQTRERFLVGTLSEGAIIAVGPDGKPEVLVQADVENGLWAITGLHADATKNRLWVSTSAIPSFAEYSPADRGRAALLEFDLKTLKQVNRFNMPQDGLLHELGSLAVTDAGDVYVLDFMTSMVYRKAAGGQALEPFVGSAEMDSLSAIAVSYDNRRLYVADRYKGILVVDPIEQTSEMLAGPEAMNLGRISSLAYGQKKLYMVQNGMEPERLMQLDLDDLGTGVTEILPMASAITQFDGPGLGLYKGGFVYYFVNLGSEGSEPAQMMRTALVTSEGMPEYELDRNVEPQSGD